VVVRVHTDEGLVGLGEATPLSDWGGDFNRYAGETPQTVVHVVEDLLAPIVSGADAFDVEAIVDRMARSVAICTPRPPSRWPSMTCRVKLQDYLSTSCWGASIAPACG
jgi:L-alanine-DL-glutamate epimerase-like enolase superfamily enzyme